jgi:cell division septation protein DedD
MFQDQQNDQDTDKDIVLESRQVLGIFFLFAVIVGIAFVAGFMVGHGSFDFAKKSSPDSPVAGSSGALTRTVEPASSPAQGSSPAPPGDNAETDTPKPAPPDASVPTEQTPARESPKSVRARVADEKFKSLPTEESADGEPAGLYQPQAGQQFWQVTAQSRDKAATVAKNLIRSGFPAHVAPSPDPRLFRVLIGPLKNQSDAASTRAALREKGFNDVMARNY